MSQGRDDSDLQHDPRRDEPDGDEFRWEEEKVFGGSSADSTTSPPIGDDRQTTDRQRYLRLVADFDNFRKRVQKDRETVVIYANERLVRDILPLVDDLERALATSPSSELEATSFHKGLKHILDRFRSILDGAGARTFVALGQPFNPSVHEAVFQRVEEGRAEGLVLEELEKGYLFNGKLLRPAKVVVNSLARPLATRSIELGAQEAREPAPRPGPEPRPPEGPSLEVETPFTVRPKAATPGPQPRAAAKTVQEPHEEPRHQVVIEDEEDLGSLEDWDRLFKSEETKGKV
jgi:molecular chaperone GrpE